MDLVNVGVGDWIISGSNEQIYEILLQVFDLQLMGTSGTSYPIFRSSNPDPTKRRRYKFAQGGRGKAKHLRPTITFSGELIVSPMRPIRNLESSVSLRLDLGLNVTRFIQAQRLRPTKNLSKIRSKDPKVLILETQEKWYAQEELLVSDNNLIIGSEPRFAYAVKKHAIEHTAEMLDAIIDAFTNHIQAAADLSGAEIRITDYCSLTKLEAYWEFSSDQPIHLSETVGSELNTLGNEAWTAHRILSPYQVQNKGMSKKHQFEVRRGQWVRIYPKTTGRVRLEFISNPLGMPHAIGSHTSTQPSSLISWLNRCVDLAAGEVNSALEHVNASLSPSAIHYPPYRLIQRIHTASRKEVSATRS